ncbi:MAG: phosphoribosyl-ATP diphosphatase [Hyphomicrobiales bacterium]
MSGFSLETLAATIVARAHSDDEGSYTRKLFNKGAARCAKKFGEEAFELAIATAEGKTDEIRAEAADVLYHLLVLLEASGVSYASVVEELAGRTGQTGLQEKASRPKG